MVGIATIDRSMAPEEPALAERMPQGLAFSAVLHLSALVLIAVGLPTLFHRPPLQDQPIAVQLVTIAPDTRATKTNAFKPKADAKPDTPIAPPAPKPEPKPEPPQAVPEPPPAAAAPPPAPEPPAPKPEAKVQPAPPPEPKPEVNTPPPPPPPPKPVEAQAPPPPPRLPEPKPKPEPRQQVAHVQSKPEPKKQNAAAFDALMKNLTPPNEKKPDPAAFDSLLKNLTREPTMQTDDTPPQPRKRVASAAPSSQPKAPLGAQLTASEMDLLREQLYHCWNIPAGARDAKDLVIEVKVQVGPDGVARQATIVDAGRMSDPIYRAAAESARRAFFHRQCTPLRVPEGKYETWKDLVVDFNPKDIL
jgi:hypothetical protein